MRILNNTQIDFLGKRYMAWGLSAILIVGGLSSLVAKGGPRLGIDFAGGSQIIVRFADTPDLDAMRDALAAAGSEEATIQEFVSESNEYLIRTPGIEEDEQIDTAVTTVSAALTALLGEGGQAGLNVNIAGREEWVTVLNSENPLGFDMDADLENAVAAYRAQIDTILTAKAEMGLFTSWEQIDELGIDPGVLASVKDNGWLGGFTIVGSESVGPQVGRDLRRQTSQAIIWALLGMLAYISYRFEFKFGIAAVVALVHDVTIALGAFSLTNREFNLPVIAAFLTIVGYSLNDTVVVFDRIRENTTTLRRMSPFDRINTSLNQTLSRTLLTSTTTLIVVTGLFFFGGPVINDFSFALLIGVLVGTYSSLFIASPIVYEWQTRQAEKRAR